jgi:CelD/BcsL family acetyltransferase involved in cellulose biosynthesis
MTLELTVFDDEQGFDALKDEWNALLRRSRFDTIFLTWEWQTTWWRHLGKPRGPLYLVAARDTGRLVGIFPLYLQETALQIVGCIEVSDYLDLIVEAGQEEAVYRAFLDWLQGPDAPPWQHVDLCNQPETSLSYTLLPELARASGFAADVLQEDVCPVIILPKCPHDAPDCDAWEQYLTSLDKKERHEIRRKLRRIEREAPEAVVRCVTAPGDDLEAAVETFIGLHRNSRADKHSFMTPEMQDYFRAVAQTLGEAGWLQLSFLEIDSRAVATYFCFDYGHADDRDILVYNSGYDPSAVPQLSPGWVLLARLIRHAIELGRGRFDFLQGSEDYKYRFGGVDTKVHRTLLRRA